MSISGIGCDACGFSGSVMDETFGMRVPCGACQEPVEPMRLGQTLFNAIVTTHPVFAESIRGTNLDPYHHDERIPDVLRAWAQHIADNRKVTS